MISWRAGRLALALALGVVGGVRAAPLAAYGKLPMIEQAAISPDGATVAYIVTDGEQRSILFERVADEKLLGKIPAAGSKVRSIQWAGSEHLIITVSRTTDVAGLEGPRREWFTAVVFDLAHGKLAPLIHDVGDTLGAVLDTPEIRMIGGHPFAFAEAYYFQNSEGTDSLFKVDIDKGTTALERAGADHTSDWVVDAKGAVLAVDAFDPKARRWTLRLSRGMGWKIAETMTEGISPPRILGLGRDGRSVLLSASEGDLDALREVAGDTGVSSPPFAIMDRDALIRDPVTEALIGVHALAFDRDIYVFFDPTDQKLWAAVARAFPGDRVTLQSMSADHRKMVVLVDSPTDGPTYAIVDLNTRKASWLGDVYGLTPEDIGPREAVAWRAADNTHLTGYLTLPHGRPGKDLPLIVFPHGGPAARDEPGFDWWAQAMASRGYAVLQVNYRGSEGLGWAFESAGFGQWGRKMQTDLSDGVRWLAGRGVIDPKRVCIVGASYGGYAALAGVTLDLGVYRCAVAVAGVADPRRMIDWDQERDDDAAAQRYWLRYMGAEHLRDASLQAISPLAHVDKVTAPVLLIHGKDDTVVAYGQSQAMFDALRRAGKTVDFIPLKAEDHWLSRGETRLQMLQATMDFVEKNNPP